MSEDTPQAPHSPRSASLTQPWSFFISPTCTLYPRLILRHSIVSRCIMTTSITFYTNALSEKHKQHVPFTVSVPTSALLLDKAKALIPNTASLTDENFLPWCPRLE